MERTAELKASLLLHFYLMRSRKKKRPLPLSQVYRLLESGPVTLVTTTRGDQPNIMAMSWHTMLEFEPPLVGCVISNRNYSYQQLTRNRECVINIPTVEIAAQTVGCGNTSGRTKDKFKTFGLTALPSARVRPPLIKECYANLECKVIDTRLVRKYCFFVLEVVQAWIEEPKSAARTLHHLGKGVFLVAGKTIRMRSKMK